jgi:hypothetical protein
VLVITQLPTMMRSFGLSSTFKAMPVLLCRRTRAISSLQIEVDFGSA